MPDYSYSATIKYTPCFTCPECGYAFPWTAPIQAAATSETVNVNAAVTFNIPIHRGLNDLGKPCSLASGKKSTVYAAVYRNGKAVQMLVSDAPIPVDWWKTT
jgi:hypothetical protein